MMKSLILLFLCGALLVTALPKMNKGGKYRVARQMPNPMSMMGGASAAGGKGGDFGNLAMQGLGNIPDPTAIIAKGQEMAGQFVRGRRQAPAPKPGPPSQHMSI